MKLSRLAEHRVAARLWLYGILVSTLLPLAIVFAVGDLSVTTFLVAAVSVLVIGGVVEFAIGAGDRAIAKTIVFSGSQSALYRKVDGGLDRSIREAAHTVEILCDTLKTFTDSEDNLTALRDRFAAGVPIRILAMDPEGEGVRAVTRTRQARGATLRDSELGREVRRSVNRLIDVCGESAVCSSLRLYSEFPPGAVYRFDDAYVVTPFTFGRGGSSPALFVRRAASREDFCANLDRGFKELWEARSTSQLTQGKVKSWTVPATLANGGIERGNSEAGRLQE